MADFSRAAHDLLRRHQFPDSCADKRFLIYPWRNAGFGSELLIMSHAFAVGLSLNRIVVFEGPAWFSLNERCANASDGRAWGCWFASNLTSCPIPPASQRGRCTQKDGCQLEVVAIPNHLSDNFIIHKDYLGFHSHWIPQVFDIMIRKNLTTPISRIHWWRAAVFTWLLRPNERTALEIRQNIAQNFPNGVPEMIFMHIRGSDKVRYFVRTKFELI